MMKRKLLSIFALLCLAVSGSWAQGVNCQPEDIGKLLGSDGNVYANAADVPSGVTVSGMIAYVNQNTNLGIAIGPIDLNHNSTEGSGKSTLSQAVSSCSGYTWALPAAANGGWRLPSQDDFNKMIGAKGCQSANNLREFKGRQETSCANNAGIWGMLTTDGYWSSTEKADEPGVYYNLWANDCNSIANGNSDAESDKKYVRPCFTFAVTPSSTWKASMTYYDAGQQEGSRMRTAANVLAITSETTLLVGDPDAISWFYVSGDVTCAERIRVIGNVAVILENGCNFIAQEPTVSWNSAPTLPSSPNIMC